MDRAGAESLLHQDTLQRSVSAGGPALGARAAGLGAHPPTHNLGSQPDVASQIGWWSTAYTAWPPSSVSMTEDCTRTTVQKPSYAMGAGSSSTAGPDGLARCAGKCGRTDAMLQRDGQPPMVYRAGGRWVCSQCVRVYDRDMRLVATSVGSEHLLRLEADLTRERQRADRFAEHNRLLRQQLAVSKSTICKLRQLLAGASHCTSDASVPTSVPHVTSTLATETTGVEAREQGGLCLGRVLEELELRRR